MKLKFIFLSLLFFSACMCQKELAKRCAESFPPQLAVVRVVKIDSSHTDTLWRTTDRVEFVDTTICPPSAEGVTIIKNLPCKCPPQRDIVTTKYIETEKTVLVRDSSQSYLHRVEVQKLKDSLEKMQTKSRFLMFLTFAAFLVSFFFFRRCRNFAA